MKLTLFLLPLLLAACAFPAAPEVVRPADEEPEPSERFEEADRAARAGTGVAERLLPHGVLEFGRRDAPATLLLVTEHHCQYCQDFQKDVLPMLIDTFVGSGGLRIQLVILPLRKYRGSDLAAAGLLCAAEQQRGFAMHDRLSRGRSKTREILVAAARELDLNVPSFEECLESDETRATLETQQWWLRSLAIDFVPTYFLNGEKFVGLPYEEDLRARMEKIIGELR